MQAGNIESLQEKWQPDGANITDIHIIIINTGLCNMDGIILMERNIIFVRSQEYILRDFIEHKVKHITMKMINRIPEKNR